MTLPLTGVLPDLAPVLAPQGARAKCDQLITQMRVRRDQKLPLWRDLELFVTPYSTNVDGGIKPYDDVAGAVLDETILFCRTTLASGLYWGMTNPSRAWRQWTLTDPDLAESASAKEWLHIVNDRALTLLSRSNFYDVMAWVYDEWPTFGTSVVLIEEDERDVFRYVPFAIGSYSLADNHRGQCIAVHRSVPMTVRQIVERFAMDADRRIDTSVLPKHIQDKVRRNEWETEIAVNHLVCPNDPTAPDGVPARYQYASYYWDPAAREDEGLGGFLAKEGYHEWPFMVFRWKRVVGDPWGTDSPGIMTLGAVKSAQQMESDLLMAIEKQVKPPLVLPPELTVASLLPAAKNSVTTRQGMQIGPLHETHPTAIQQVRETQEINRERIQALWFTRLMLAFTQDARADRPTAREVEEVSGEKYLVLGRVLEAAGQTFRQASEREFAIMNRRGLLPPVPPELQGQPLNVEYTSIMAVAQKSVGLSNLERYGMLMAEMFKATGSPDLLVKTDWAQWADEVSARSGVPPRVTRTDDQVAAIQRAQAEQAEAQQAAEQAALEAKAAKDLSLADVSGENALTRVLAGSQGELPRFP